MRKYGVLIEERERMGINWGVKVYTGIFRDRLG